MPANVSIPRLAGVPTRERFGHEWLSQRSRQRVIRNRSPLPSLAQLSAWRFAVAAFGAYVPYM